MSYFRLHGSPQMYRSPYDASYLSGLARRLHADGASKVWCIFDNTASGAAAANALTLRGLTAAARTGT
jgi:uncharacterized protein YecE (DUF72 family)